MAISITTSNVNGIRAADRHGIKEWVEKNLPDIWCLQEVRAPQQDIDRIFGEYIPLYEPQGSYSFVNDICELNGRAGVAIGSRFPIKDVRYGLNGLRDDKGVMEKVDTGRWIEIDIDLADNKVLTVACAYVHSGDSSDSTKMFLKYRFLDILTERMKEMSEDSQKNPLHDYVICGDFNIAHTELDIKNSEDNIENSGFLPQERAYIDQWINQLHFVDTVRASVGNIDGPYTWWSWRGRAFDRNVGWRLDYQFATPRLASTVTSVRVDKAKNYESRTSDHAAVTVNYNIELPCDNGDKQVSARDKKPLTDSKGQIYLV